MKNLSVECRRSNCYWCWLNYQLACSGFFSFSYYFLFYLFHSICATFYGENKFISWDSEESHWRSSAEQFHKEATSSWLSFCATFNVFQCDLLLSSSALTISKARVEQRLKFIHSFAFITAVPRTSKKY